MVVASAGPSTAQLVARQLPILVRVERVEVRRQARSRLRFVAADGTVLVGVKARESFPAVLFAGMLGFGALADRLSKRSRAWPALLSAMALGAATVLVVMTVWAPTFAMAKWLAIPCGLLGGGWSVGLFAALQYMLPSAYRASATALFVAVTTLLGYFIGPWLTGALSESMGDNAASLQLALTIIVPVGVVASALAFLAASRLERDRIALAEAG